MTFFLFVGVTSAILLIYLYLELKINRHWKRHGIPGPKPIPFFGNLLPVVLLQKSIGQLFVELYNAYPDEPVVGYFHFMQPRLLIRDTELIEKMFAQDFQHFYARFGAFDIFSDPLNTNLFVLSGNPWKAVRAKFAPMFSTNQLRNIFPALNSIGDDFVRYLEKNKDAVNMNETATIYAVDVICSVFFGVEPGPMEIGFNELRKQCSNVMPPGFSTFYRFQTIFLWPSLAAKLKINVASQRSINYFLNLIKEVLTHRKTTGSSRNDFVQQMMGLQTKGCIEVDPPNSNDPNLPKMKIKISDEMLMGQSLAFLIAAIEGTVSSCVYMILDLAVNNEKQETARAEIIKVLDSHGGQISFDAMKEMVYLEACMKETLRIHSPITMLFRRCNKNYKIPKVPYTVSTGENIVVAPQALHLDPKFYPEPHEFRPERWENDLRPSSTTYLPWGYGPRLCTGVRFALEELKCALVKILLNYKVSLHPTTNPVYTPKPMSFVSVPAENILVTLERL